MKSFVVLLVGMLLGACGTHTAPLAPVALSHIDAAAEMRTMTVGLVSPREDGTIRPFCTGVWVSATSILTANHCMKGEDVGAAFLYTTFGDVYPRGPKEEDSPRVHLAQLYRADAAHDLALLRVVSSPGSHGIARTRVAPIVQGMFAQAMGHSLGLWYSYSSGDVSAVREKDFDDGAKLWLQTTAAISPGNSGGGLFDSDAALIGICHGSFTKGQHLNLFVHQAYIDAILAGAT